MHHCIVSCSDLTSLKLIVSVAAIGHFKLGEKGFEKYILKSIIIENLQPVRGTELQSWDIRVVYRGIRYFYWRHFHVS